FHVTGVQTCALPIWIATPPPMPSLEILLWHLDAPHLLTLISSEQTSAPDVMPDRYHVRMLVISSRYSRFVTLPTGSSDCPRTIRSEERRVGRERRSG